MAYRVCLGDDVLDGPLGTVPRVKRTVPSTYASLSQIIFIFAPCLLQISFIYRMWLSGEHR